MSERSTTAAGSGSHTPGARCGRGAGGVARGGLALGLLAAAALAAAPAAATPLLSELLYDAEGADAGRVFVELHGTPGAALDGLVLEGVNGSDGGVTDTLALSGAFPEDGVFVVADGEGGETQVAGADLVADFDPQNGPDSVQLRGPEGVIDALGYGDFGTDDVFAGEGAPASDATAGASLARRAAGLDTGDNAADFVLLSEPTPGALPEPVPEPAAGLLLGMGLLALARPGRPRRRRPRGTGSVSGPTPRRR